MKRIFIFILIFSILLTCSIVPVSATAQDIPSAFDPSFVDLLGHPSYTMTQGSITQTSNYPLFNMTESGEIKYILGEGENRYTCDYFIACVYAKYQPIKVRITNESIGEGTHIKSVGNYHYYRFDKQKTIVDRLYFFITMPSAYRGTVGLDMLMGVCNDTIEIDNVLLSTWGRFKEDGVYYKQELFNQNVTLPYAYQKNYITNGTTADPIEFFVSFKYTFDIPVAESFSFVFTSASIWDDNYDEGDIFHGGITLTDSNGTVLQTLPYTAIDTAASSVIDGIAVTIYTVNVDISGLDLQGNSLRFTACLSPVFPHYGTAADNDYNFYHFRLYSAGYKLQHDVAPWYLTFFHWVRSEFTKLKTALSTHFNTLNSNLSTFFNTLGNTVSRLFGNLNTSMQTEFTNLKTNLSSLFTSLKDTINAALGVGIKSPNNPQLEDDVQQGIQDNQSSNNDLDDIVDGLETVPAVPDFNDTGLDDFNTQVEGQVSPVQPVFIVIFQNPVILQMITYVFMFALGGFLLFGER